MCKNWKYSKGPPFGVLVKNIKYVPQFEGHLIYVPHVPHLRDSWGTKSSSAQFTLKSSFREGICFLLGFSVDGVKGQMKKTVKKSIKTWKIYDFLVLHPTSHTSYLIPPRFFGSSYLIPHTSYLGSSAPLTHFHTTHVIKIKHSHWLKIYRVIIRNCQKVYYAG